MALGVSILLIWEFRRRRFGEDNPDGWGPLVSVMVENQELPRTF